MFGCGGAEAPRVLLASRRRVAAPAGTDAGGPFCPVGGNDWANRDGLDRTPLLDFAKAALTAAWALGTKGAARGLGVDGAGVEAGAGPGAGAAAGVGAGVGAAAGGSGGSCAGLNCKGAAGSYGCEPYLQETRTSPTRLNINSPFAFLITPRSLRAAR